MENPKLINQYREQLLTLHGVTVAVVSVVEIIAYIIFVHFGVQSFSFNNEYLWLNVVTPICINVAAHFVARGINRSNAAKPRQKNASVIYGAFVTAFVVSMFHRDYTVALCAFVFPIILSAMYNDKKLLTQSFWLAMACLSATVVVMYMENKLDLTKSINVIILYGFVAISYLSGVISIKFSGRSFSVIEEQAIANSDLETKIELDPMTQLYNHKAFYGKLDFAINKSKEEKIDCCLAMIDIDDFKRVNDTYGHDAGDVVLINVANILKECCDDSDIVCRYGGEEFAVIFIGKTIEEATKNIERALNEFSSYKFDFTNSSLTFSCGIANFRENETGNELFARADEYLYKSKNNGKNQITAL